MKFVSFVRNVNFYCPGHSCLAQVDNAIHWTNRYPANSIVCFVNTYLLDSNLSGPGCSKGGQHYPPDKSLSSGLVSTKLTTLSAR